MKTIKKGNDYLRVDDATAEDLVAKGQAEYAPKHKFKETGTREEGELTNWKEHHGYFIPKDIAQRDRITLKRRAGNEFTTDHPHSWEGWKWNDLLHSPMDIVAYRKEN